MKKFIFIVLILFAISPLSAQVVPTTDREILLDLAKQQGEMQKQMVEIQKQIVEIQKQQAETNKQQAVANARFETKFESIEKRMDISFYLGGCILAGIFGLVVLIFWDRRTAIRPIEDKTQEIQRENLELKKEIALIKEKELKLEKRILRNENDFKRIAEIDVRFARNS